MPRFIIKIPTLEGPRYLEWSTVVDAPVSGLMPIETFRRFYETEYGRSSMDHFQRAMARCEETGTSVMYERLAPHEAIAGNRAGPDETELTLDEIIRDYSPGGRAVS